MKRTRLLGLILLLACTTSVSAQSSYEILLKRGNLLPAYNIRQSYLDSFSQSALRSGGKGMALLQFTTLPNEDIKTKLSAAGITLLDYVPHQAYTISFTGNLQSDVLSAAGARSVVALPALYKMDDYLARNHFPAPSVKAPGTVDVWISFPKTFSAEAVASALAELKAEVIANVFQSYRVLHLRIATTRVQAIAAQPFIEYMQAAPGEDKPFNYNSRAASRAGLLNTSAALGGRGLRGEGVVVGVGDNADIQTHMDFRGRIIPRASSGAAGHGTHVSGIVAGGGNINELYTGIAPRATLIGQTFSGVLINAPTYVQDYGMVITNNSYGDIVECDYYGTYDLTSRILDQMAVDLPHLQNVFASGNSGTSVCMPFTTGYRTVFGGYQSAKNVITVGSTTDSGMISSFSSRGPVRDGRTKPEVVAMGSFVASTWPTNIYSYNNGTSMAAPAVSGGLALLYQRYRQLHGGANPKTGLVKALLSAGAADRGNDGPDYLYGFGWMNLLRSVEMLEGARYFESSVATSGSNNHTITVPANTAALKVLLYWNDPAATPMSSRALVHDLDVKVTAPSGSTTLPLVLDTAVARVSAAATTGIDRINNMEQVVITSPAPGNYTLNVQGHSVAQTAAQEYFLVYDVIPAALQITAPAAGEAWAPSTFQYDMMKIAWESAGYSGNVTIEFSADNGATWSTVAVGIPVARGLYTWWVPATPTSQGRIRITKEGNGESTLSGAFTILAQPAISLDAVQCEGYIRLNWTSVAGADDYEVMWLQGEEMTTRAIVAGNTYTFSGLSKDSTYWVTVRARKGGRGGRRTQAISRQPSNGSCSGSISDGDLKLQAILAPLSGRKFTSGALTSSAVVRASVRNLDDAPVSGFTITYSVNGGPAVTESLSQTIAAGAVYEHAFAQTVDLSATGAYRLEVFVKNNAPDPVASNDTIVTMVRQLENAPINLANTFIDNLETALPMDYSSDTIGLAGIDRFDFTSSTPLGRLRSFVNSGMAYSGQRALTLDVERSLAAGNTSYLVATYNLGAYNAAVHDIRLDFQQLHHGQKPHADNRVWIRGNDAANWIEVYDLAAPGQPVGVFARSGSIELGDWLLSAGQDFSTSFQVRWGQQGTMPATDRFNAAGYTIDDIRLYMAVNDQQLRSIDAPVAVACGLASDTRISVSVRNSVNAPVANIPVRYRVGSGPWVTETIPSIGANATILYHFSQGADLSLHGAHAVQVVVDFPGDNFRDNDTAVLQLFNAPVISSFPYLQTFEGGSAYWYSGGKKNSWELGTPASPKIRGAASGANAWKTGLLTGYNNEENSYLYSPCFDVRGMIRPTLSFSFSLDIEDCGNTICDAAWVEYSADGLTWTKLGSTATGTNWYNHPTNVWSRQAYSYWHVATTALPQNIEKLRLRFVFTSDVGLTREGIAIDDIHIYDLEEEIFEGTTPVTVNSNITGTGWTHFSHGGRRVASLRSAGSLGTTAVQPFIHTGAVRFTDAEYYHNRSLVITPAQLPADSVDVRMYFLDAEADSLVKAKGCNTCYKPASAYELGVSNYTDPDPAFLNGSISDNQQGIWRFIPRTQVQIVPYGKGYYAQFRTKDLSEFWLNSGSIQSSDPLPVKLMDFTVTKVNDDVALLWQVFGEQQMLRYEVELARGDVALQAGQFEKIGEVTAVNAAGTHNYSFTDAEPGKTGRRYYRLKMIDDDGSVHFAPVRAVDFDNITPWQVYPNPSGGKFFLLYQANNDELMRITLYDATGRLLQASSVAGNGSLQKFEADLTSKAAGIYLLRVEGGGRKQSYKLYRE